MIRVEGLHKRLGEFHLQDVTLEIAEGEYFVLLGPTGAGKTVLLECIAGLHRPDCGKVLFDGLDYTRVKMEQRGVSYVPQDYALFPHISVARNMGFGLELRRVPRQTIRAEVQEMAETLGVRHLLARRPRTLSGGEQQRVALGRALLTRPKILLLDEPLSALDERTREVLADVITSVTHEFRAAVMHVCHNFDEAAKVAQRIGVMRDGRLVQAGTKDDVFRRPRTRFVAEFVGTVNILDVEALDRASAVRVADLTFETDAAIPPGPLCVSIRPEDIHLGRPCSEHGNNAFPGRLVSAEDRGGVVRIGLDIGVPLQALLTRQAFRAADVNVGNAVSVTIERSGVHVFARDEGEDAPATP